MGEGGVFAGAGLLGTPMSIFLVQAIIVILLTRVLAAGLHYVGQPRVIAEVIGGIILGPSVFGNNVPGFSTTIFPKSSLNALTLIANIGLVLYLFLVGIEMDPKTMLSNAKKTSVVAIFGIGLPFGLGFALAHYLYINEMQGVPGYDNVNEKSFAVFICVAISITAFPVLARILNETNILTTVVGSTALSAAALDDVTAWSLLALAIALIHAGNGGKMITAAWIFLSVAAYALGMLGIVRPAWGRLIHLIEKSESRAFQTFLMALTFLVVFFSAWATEVLGVHAIFGAFLFGLAMPRGHPFTLKISERIEDIVQIVFLPLYFTLSGLKTDVGKIEDGSGFLVLVIVVVTAIAAKFIGCSVGAKLMGLTWRESASVGILMNTRGLVELIVLNIGLEAKVITPKLFTILVLMAIITTVMTTPLMHIFYPPSVRTYVDQEGDGTGRVKARLTKTIDDVDILCVVHHLDEIPAITAMIHLLKPTKKGDLRITGAHLVESSITTTDILRARARGTHSLTSDPSLQMLSVVGGMVGARVETDVLIGNPRSFAAEITRKATERMVDVVLIPHRQGMYFLTDSYSHFLAETITRAKSGVVLLVNPTATPHNLLAAPGERREIMVVITGEQNDCEVLCLARRFLLAPEVMLTLCTIEDPLVHTFDDRVRVAVDRLRAAVSDANRLKEVTLTGEKASRKELVQVATGRQHDFIIVGHTSTALQPPVIGGLRGSYGSSNDMAKLASGSQPSTPRGSAIGGQNSIGASSSGNRRSRVGHLLHHQTSSVGMHPDLYVLGSVAMALMEDGNVQSSLLVVHASQSFGESTLSVRRMSGLGTGMNLGESITTTTNVVAPAQPAGVDPLSDKPSSVRPALKTLEIYEGPGTPPGPESEQVVIDLDKAGPISSSRPPLPSSMKNKTAEIE